MSALQPSGLMVNLLSHPERTTISSSSPRFSWVVHASHAGAIQHGFQILVASRFSAIVADEGDLWDSGVPAVGSSWTTDRRSVAVPYEGASLEANREFFWKVRTWLSAQDISPWSEVQRFLTGDLVHHFQPDHYEAEVEVIHPTRFIQLEPGEFFVDFGRASFGTVELRCEVESEIQVEVNLGEVREGDRAICRQPGGSRRYRSVQLRLRPGNRTHRVVIPADPRNTGPFAVKSPASLFEVMPFRFCEITGAPSTLNAKSVVQLAVHYPFDDEAASFSSSSSVLNDVWDLCHHTVKATSAFGLYVDGDRERIPYESDAYINQLGHFACDREYTMSRRTLEHLVFSPTWPTEWHLYLVLAAWNDYLFTGDDRFISSRFDELAAKSLVGLARKDGLISVENMTEDILGAIHFDRPSRHLFPQGVRDVIDWPEVERDGHESLPYNSIVNGLHYRALCCLSRIARAIGRGAEASLWDDRSEAVREAFHRSFLDSRSGLVVDGEGSRHSSLHANMFALASGVLLPEHIAHIAKHVRSRGMACSVYASQILLEALYAAGESNYALSLLTATGLRSWAHMVYDVGTTITLEAWDDSIKPNQDWNHAWGAAPANIIPFGLLGVRPLEPGWRRAIIDPQPGRLAWARVRVPTIRGPIVASCTNLGSLFSLEVEVPANMTVTIGLPCPDGEPHVVSDGRIVVGVVRANRVYIDDVGSGKHVVAQGRHG